jgi:branched-subunit amino acid ABC-type transport system permease component
LGLAALLGVLAGIFLAPALLLDPFFMLEPFLKGFTAILGGLNSLPGAILQRIILGWLKALPAVTYPWPLRTPWLSSSSLLSSWCVLRAFWERCSRKGFNRKKVSLR